MLPYIEIEKNNKFYRTFTSDTSEEELVWHRDKEDRAVLALEPTDWKIQYDNSLPHVIPLNSPLFIPKDTYHRLIKGTNTLVLEITKYS